jgi:hypothetical protein
LIFLTATEYRQLPYYETALVAPEGVQFSVVPVRDRYVDLVDGDHVWIMQVDRTNHKNLVIYTEGCIQNKGDDRVLI